MNPDLLITCLLNEIDYYVGSASDCVREMKSAAADDPSICDAWYDPAEKRVYVRRTHGSPLGEKIAGLKTTYHPEERPHTQL